MKRGELVSSEDFVDQFIACGRVVDAVVVFVTVAVEVVVLQEKVFAGQPSDVAIGVASYSKDIARMRESELLLDFQGHVLLTIDSTRQKQDTLVFRHSEVEGILKADYEGMFAQADVVDGAVVVPGVPVMGVSSR